MPFTAQNPIRKGDTYELSKYKTGEHLRFTHVILICNEKTYTEGTEWTSCRVALTASTHNPPANDSNSKREVSPLLLVGTCEGATIAIDRKGAGSVSTHNPPASDSNVLCPT